MHLASGVPKAPTLARAQDTLLFCHLPVTPNIAASSPLFCSGPWFLGEGLQSRSHGCTALLCEGVQTGVKTPS